LPSDHKVASIEASTEQILAEGDRCPTTDNSVFVRHVDGHTGIFTNCYDIGGRANQELRFDVQAACNSKAKTFASKVVRKARDSSPSPAHLAQLRSPLAADNPIPSFCLV
jgi:hypothetical protein